jgi:hypothetical protein
LITLVVAVDVPVMVLRLMELVVLVVVVLAV